MTPQLFENWFRSIEHQFGRMKCAALACNLVHQSTLVNLNQIQPYNIVDIHRVIAAFETFYEGSTFREGVFQWLRAFESQTDKLNYDFTAQTATLCATNYLLKEMLLIPTNADVPAWEESALLMLVRPTNDDVPAWERSILFSIDALSLPVSSFMIEAETFLEHLE